MQKPILLDLPHEIETDRMILRAPRFGDGAALREAVIKNRAHLEEWMPWARGSSEAHKTSGAREAKSEALAPSQIASVDSFEERVRRGLASWILHEDFWFLVFAKGSGEMIGGAGLHRVNWAIPRAEIACWVDADYEGKGYVSEGGEALIKFAFEHLKCRRLEARCNSRNLKSKRAVEKLGFNYEGCLAQNDEYAVGGGDTLIFSLVKEVRS